MTRLELTRLVRTRSDGPLPGDKCPVPTCNGKIGVDKVLPPRGGWVIRYLCCNVCRHRPENHKWVAADESNVPTT